jgi:MerR family transcriptional regulator, thiopeptide resistance regulator
MPSSPLSPRAPAGGIAMKFEALKVGELARRTGLTVRTLHHYDEIGLLKASLHTDAGYRLYTAADVARLQQVLSLRQLGFSLEEVRACLDRPDFSPLEVIRLHVARLREQIELQRKLCERLEALAEHFRTAGEVSADEFLYTIEVMTMIEKYYTPEQLKYLEERRKAGGPEMQELTEKAPQMWADLFADVTAAMDAGVPPENPKAQELAKRWLALVTAFTGGDPGIYNSLRAMYENEDNVMGTDTKALRPKMEYILKAAAAAGIKHPGQ